MTIQHTAPEIERLLTVKQVSIYLSVSTATIWRHAKTGLIPKPVYIGKSVRWRQSDLRKLLEDQK